MSNGPQIRQVLRDWIVANSGKVAPDEVTEETPIIERRIISSVQVMDLILFLEQLGGKPIDVDRLQPGAFHSIDAIVRGFLQDVAHEC
jgi:acyl carrier protein